jgi:hypothetical protein
MEAQVNVIYISIKFSFLKLMAFKPIQTAQQNKSV